MEQGGDKSPRAEARVLWTVQGATERVFHALPVPKSFLGCQQVGAEPPPSLPRQASDVRRTNQWWA